MLPALALFVGCGTAGSAAGSPAAPPEGGTLTVLAAASLSDAFAQLAHDFEHDHPGAKVRTSFGSSSTLAAQLQQGADADVFAPADQANMDKVVSLLAGPPVIFAHNRLEIVVAPGNPRHVAGLADLARPGLLVALCQASVPCGRYSAQALATAGVTVVPASQETDVKSVLGRVELGEADAGVVYASDVLAAGPRAAGVVIPDAQNVTAAYPIAALSRGRQELARRFIAYVQGPVGRAILKGQRFTP